MNQHNPTSYMERWNPYELLAQQTLVLLKIPGPMFDFPRKDDFT